jgi:hypothetical protein
MANLLQKASIVLTPTAYDTSEALCVKPSDGSGDFDFSRNSAATRVNAQGLVENVQILSSNLVQNGSFSNGSTDWTLDDWSVGNSLVSSGNTSSLLRQDNIYTSTTSIYKTTFKAKSVNGTSVTLRVYDGSGNNFETITITSSDFQDFTLTRQRQGASPSLFFYNNSNAEIEITNISVIEISNDTNLPRINYEGFSFDGSGNIIPNSGCGSWLFEPQSTNLITYSEDFSQWDVKTRISITNNIATSPSGNINASKIIPTSTIGTHQLRENLTSVTGNYTYSIFAKKGEYKNILLWDDTLSGGVGVNLDNLSVFRDQNNQGYKIVDYGNDWIRISLTHTFSSQIMRPSIYIYDNSATPQISFAGNDVDGLFTWGAQVEALSYATSYIPTSGSQVTRNKDVCTGGASVSSINSTEGVLYFEGSTLVNGGANRYISLSNNTSSNRLQVIFHNNSNRLSIGMANPIGSVASINDFSFVQTNNNKVAVSYSALGLRLFVNGILRGSNTDNASFTPNTLTTLDFALWNQTTAPFEGNTKCLALFETLTDAELISLTTL